MTPNVNVLVADSRADHLHHRVALASLSNALTHASTYSDFKLLGAVFASLLRLVTPPRVFSRPTPTLQAVAFIDGILAVPGAAMLAVQGEWPQRRKLYVDQNTSASVIFDAWTAACMPRHQMVRVPFDHDFVCLLPPKHLQLRPPTP